MRSDKEEVLRSQRRGITGPAKGAATLAIVLGLLSGCGGISSSKDSAAVMLTEQKADVAPAQAASGGAAQNKEAAAADSNKALSPSAGGSFTGETAPEASDPFSRKIIYKANLVMQVEKYQETAAKVQDAVKQSGAYILQSNENTAASEKSGTFIIKVPANGFQSLLTQLEQINPTMQKNLQGQDVTEEYVDLSARLKAKQIAEGRLIAFMEKATKTDELVAFSNELGKVQEEIERIKGRMRYLEQNVTFSTIELRVMQKISSAEVIGSRDRGPLLNRAVAALNDSAAVLSVILQWIVVVFAGALPVVLLLALIAIPLWIVRRKGRGRLADIRKRLAEQNTASPLPVQPDSTAVEPTEEPK